MAVLFNKSPTRAVAAEALLVGLILCCIPTTAVSASEQVLNVGNANGVASSPAEYQEFEIGMPLYRIKEHPNVLIPATMVQELYTAAAPSPSPSQSPFLSPSPSPFLSPSPSPSPLEDEI